MKISKRLKGGYLATGKLQELNNKLSNNWKIFQGDNYGFHSLEYKFFAISKVNDTNLSLISRSKQDFVYDNDVHLINRSIDLLEYENKLLEFQARIFDEVMDGFDW